MSVLFNQVFQIWITLGPRSEYVTECMRRTHHLSAHYTLIGDENFLGVEDFRHAVDIEDAMMKDPRIASMSKRKNGRIWTDVMRVWFLWKNPEYIFLDADLQPLKPFDVLPEAPAFGRYHENIDGHVIVGNGHGEFFNGLLSRMHALFPDQCFPMIESLPRNYTNVVEDEYFDNLEQCKLELTPAEIAAHLTIAKPLPQI